MLFTARYVVPVTTPHVEYGALLVRDGKIVEIGDIDHLREAHPDEPVKDFGTAAILPGFIDLHTHVENTALRGVVDDWPYSRWKIEVMKKQRLLGPQDWEDSALLGALEALGTGITYVGDLSETGAAARAVQAAGLRAFIYREVSTMQRSSVDDVLGAAIADIDAWRETFGREKITVGIAPHSPYSCHPALFEAISEYAADGTPVSMHLAGSREEYEFVKYGSSMLAMDYRAATIEDAPPWLPTGVSPVQYVQQWGILDVPNFLAVHCTQVDDEDVRILASHDCAVAYCPRCNAKLGMGTAPLEKLIKAGIRVGLGTDSPASNDDMDVFDEMRIGLLLQRAVLGEQNWLGARRFVRMATLDAARAFGVEDSVGSLEPGKQADMAVIDFSHSSQIPTDYPYGTIVHTVSADGILATVVAGETLYEDGVWRTLDEERIVARALEIRAKLRS